MATLCTKIFTLKLKCQPQIILHHLGLQRSELDSISWILILRLNHHINIKCCFVHAAALEDILVGMVECVGGDIEMLVEDLLFAKSAVSLVMDGDNCFQLAASETSPRPSQAPPNTSHHHFWAKLGIKTKSFSLFFVLNCW